MKELTQEKNLISVEFVQKGLVQIQLYLNMTELTTEKKFDKSETSS